MLQNKTLNSISLNTIPLNAIPLNKIPLNTKACNFCTIYIALFVIFFIITICISSAYFHWHLKKDNIPVRFNPSAQKTI